MDFSQVRLASYVSQCIGLLNATESRQAVKYVLPGFVVKVTRRLWKGKIHLRDRRAEYVVTIGEPGYIEQREIKRLTEVGTVFPVKKIKLRPLVNGGKGRDVKRRRK